MKGKKEGPISSRWPTIEDAKRICEEKGLDGVIIIGLRSGEGEKDTVGSSSYGKNDEMKKGMKIAQDNIYECWKMAGK